VTVEEFSSMLKDAARDLGARIPPRLIITFRPLTEAYFRTTTRGGELRVVVNDALEDAPGDALRGLAEVIIARASGAARPRRVGKAFWDHVGTEGLRVRMQENYLARQRSFVASPEGRAWDLRAVFDVVNDRYFDGALEHPMLGWTLRPLTYRWGWYSSMVQPRGLIVLNSLLDDPRVPAFVLEGTMHHEMLHMVQGPSVTNRRRVVHTPDFRARERQFERFSDLRPEYRRILRRYGREDPVRRGQKRR
jgi:hypothetical protein